MMQRMLLLWQFAMPTPCDFSSVLMNVGHQRQENMKMNKCQSVKFSTILGNQDQGTNFLLMDSKL